MATFSMLSPHGVRGADIKKCRPDLGQEEVVYPAVTVMMTVHNLEEGMGLEPDRVNVRSLTRKVNTELSAVVNHLAKLNHSGDVKAMTDREKTRASDCKTTKSCLKANSDDCTSPCTESASRDENCGREAHE